MRQRLLSSFSQETSSLGVRVHECERVSMERDTKLVGTQWGHPVRVKVARIGETIANVHAEYEDCAKVARTEGVPLKQVFRDALDAYYSRTPLDSDVKGEEGEGRACSRTEGTGSHRPGGDDD
jgi:uncharacterized protein (DUF111 family)